MSLDDLFCLWTGRVLFALGAVSLALGLVSYGLAVILKRLEAIDAFAQWYVRSYKGPTWHPKGRK